jgi:hypothetical protein
MLLLVIFLPPKCKGNLTCNLFSKFDAFKLIYVERYMTFVCELNYVEALVPQKWGSIVHVLFASTTCSLLFSTSPRMRGSVGIRSQDQTLSHYCESVLVLIVLSFVCCSGGSLAALSEPSLEVLYVRLEWSQHDVSMILPWREYDLTMTSVWSHQYPLYSISLLADEPLLCNTSCIECRCALA